MPIRRAPCGTSDDRVLKRPFRPRARLLQLLGDQLIGSPRLALFELVKNAYDADADEVTITFEDLGTPAASIVIRDNGQGMSLDTIEHVWLVPGHDHREREREGNVRSPRYGRLPLGEKGVGRFAVHKLGDSIELVTRAEGESECHARFDWEELLKETYLTDAEITVSQRTPEVFKDTTGTLIKVGRLRSDGWTRGEIRDLYRQVTSIASPFGDRVGDFEVRLDVPEHPEWVGTLPGVHQLLEMAPYRFEFDFDGERLHYRYEFVGVPGLKLEKRVVERNELHFQIPPAREPDDLDPIDQPRPKRQHRITADSSTIEGIGRVSGRFHIFDRDRKILPLYGDTRFLERYLNQNGGVRVYRDSMRVYNYGEPSDDWLGLDLRRVNEPTKRLSRNITIGVVDLGLAESQALHEKTNREGFVENEAYDRLQRLVLGALWVLQVERNIDKERIRELTGGPPDVPQGVDGPLAELRRLASENKIGDVLEPTIRKIEDDYNMLRENFARSGVSHAGLRLHGIKLECPALEEDGPDATATFASSLVLGALTNLIDNAVHWVKVRHADLAERRIFVNVVPDYEGGPAIVVADNGSGFLDDPATMISPFFTRRPGGSGLGLYFANLVMDLNEGHLVFPTMDQAEVPDGYDGAVAALVFGNH